MSVRPEWEQLLQPLEEATARLASMNPEEFDAFGPVLADRQKTIDALRIWIVSRRFANEPELAMRMQKDFDRAADVLVRLRLARAFRLETLKMLRRERHLLRSLIPPQGSVPALIDCQG